MSAGDAWNPDRYESFAAERARPFFDLLGLLQGTGHAAVVDLGCGTGALTAQLHDALEAEATLGLDRSPAMLERAAAIARPALRFEVADIAELDRPAAFDVALSNAALQWTTDHRAVLARWRAALRPGGQLAVQVPANLDHPSHTTAVELAAEEPFLSALGGDPPADPVRSVLAPEEYAVVLDELGFAEQHVRLQVYGARLSSTSQVVDWVRGTSLTRFESRLAPELLEEFVDRYRGRLLARLGDRRPYFYPFKRILLWGRLPS